MALCIQVAEQHMVHRQCDRGNWQEEKPKFLVFFEDSKDEEAEDLLKGRL
jgi:hypothetical protein